MKNKINEKTTWMLFECENGARWSSTTEDYSMRKCTFSGCRSDHSVKKVGTTQEWGFKWFFNPYEGDKWFSSPQYLSITEAGV